MDEEDEEDEDEDEGRSGREEGAAGEEEVGREIEDITNQGRTRTTTQIDDRRSGLGARSE